MLVILWSSLCFQGAGSNPNDDRYDFSAYYGKNPKKGEIEVKQFTKADREAYFKSHPSYKKDIFGYFLFSGNHTVKAPVWNYME